MSWFSMVYSLMILDWILYVTVWPGFLALTTYHAWQGGNLEWVAIFYFGGYALWSVIAAMFLRKWRLPLLLPWIIMMDWVNRAIFIHAFFKAWSQPTVTSCKWDSPTRINTNGGTTS